MMQMIPNQNQLMTPRDFCMWLHGFFEISGIKTLTEKQLEVVKSHLDLMFKPSITLTTTTSGMKQTGEFATSASPEGFIC